MQRFALMNHMDVWYFRADVESLVAMVHGAKLHKRIEQATVKASKNRTSLATFPKLAEEVNGQYRIKDEPPLIFHYDPLDTNQDNLDTKQWRGFVLDFIASLPEERRILVNRYRAVDIRRKLWA